MATSGADRDLHPTRRRAISRTVFSILLAGSTVLFILVIRPFLIPLLLSAVTAGVFFPIRRRLAARFRGTSTMPAIITMLTVILMVVIPVTGLVYLAVLNVLRLAQTVSLWGWQIHGIVDSVINIGQQLGLVSSSGPEHAITRDMLLKTLEQYSSVIVSHVSRFLGNMIRIILMVIIYLYSLFFFLRDGDKILASLLDYIPLDRDQKDSILSHFVSVTRAIIKGTLVMGLIQGTIAYLGYMLAGMKSPLLWGMLTGFLAPLPNFGPILIWLPAGVLLALNGQIPGAVVVLAGVGGLMGVCDYVIRPRIIGDDIKMHDLLVFFGIFGGIALFRLPGLLIGPIIMAIFVQIWDIFRIMYASDFRAANAVSPPPAAPPKSD
ncbi:MAG TPA: AI-2E family transporter [Spirochaetia bacterium]|nr:AI-2E family transporter [Spirochaetia bacterium]